MNVWNGRILPFLLVIIAYRPVENASFQRFRANEIFMHIQFFLFRIWPCVGTISNSCGADCRRYVLHINVRVVHIVSYLRLVTYHSGSKRHKDALILIALVPIFIRALLTVSGF